MSDRRLREIVLQRDGNETDLYQSLFDELNFSQQQELHLRRKTKVAHFITDILKQTDVIVLFDVSS